MRKALIAALICTFTLFVVDQATANAAPIVLDGALGFQWGDTVDTAKKNAKKRDWVFDKAVDIDANEIAPPRPNDPKGPRPTTTLYYDGYFANEKAHFALYFDKLNYPHMSFTGITIMFWHIPMEERPSHCELLYRELAVKYGKPYSDGGEPYSAPRSATWLLHASDGKKVEINLSNTIMGFTLSYGLYRPLVRDL